MKTLSRALFLVLWSNLPSSAAVFPAAPADWLRANGGAQAAQSATQTALRGTDLAATRNANGLAGQGAGQGGGQGAGSSARPAWLFADLALGAPQPSPPAALIPAPEPEQWLIDLGPELAQIIDMIDISFGGGGADTALGGVETIAAPALTSPAPSASAPLAPVPLPPSALLLLVALGALTLLRRAKPLHLPPQREILPA